MGSFFVGQSVAFAPDYSKAVKAAKRIFNLLDRKSLIDSKNTTSGLRMVAQALHAKNTFNACFF